MDLDIEEKVMRILWAKGFIDPNFGFKKICLMNGANDKNMM